MPRVKISAIPAPTAKGIHASRPKTRPELPAPAPLGRDEEGAGGEGEGGEDEDGEEEASIGIGRKAKANGARIQDRRILGFGRDAQRRRERSGRRCSFDAKHFVEPHHFQRFADLRLRTQNLKRSAAAGDSGFDSN